MHPIIYLLLIILMAVLMHRLPPIAIALYAAVIALGLNASGWQFWWRIFKRMLLVWVSIVLIMAFNTPGEIMLSLPAQLHITYQGLYQGGLQIARLSLMLLLIALMTSALSRKQLLSAFYCISQPLRLFGLSPEQLATRLWLTIDYIEQHQAAGLRAGKAGKAKLKANLLDQFLHSQQAPRAPTTQAAIKIALPSLTGLDYVIIALMLSSLLLLWVK
jgi:energy-coupling factor transport system permease protein